MMPIDGECVIAQLNVRIEKAQRGLLEDYGEPTNIIVMLTEVRSLVKNLPRIDAEPVRHGRWIDAHMIGGGDFYHCSECGCYIEQIYFANDYNVRYCPNCGARMDGGADNV